LICSNQFIVVADFIDFVHKTKTQITMHLNNVGHALLCLSFHALLSLPYIFFLFFLFFLSLYVCMCVVPRVRF